MNPSTAFRTRRPALTLAAAALTVAGFGAHAYAGACCLGQGLCIQTPNAGACAAVAGTYRGDVTTCDTNPCDQAYLLMLPDLPEGITAAKAFAVSADGSTIVGEGTNDFSFERRAVRWTIGSGWNVEPLLGPSESSSARAVSADGRRITGSRGAAPSWNGFVWDAGTPQTPASLNNFPGRANINEIWGMSPDGQSIVGSWDGYFNNPAITGTYAGVWTRSGAGWSLTSLGDLPGGAEFSIARARANNGVTVGDGSSANGWEAFRSGTGIGDLPGGAFYSSAEALNADGSVVVGYGTRAMNGPIGPTPTHAFRWTLSAGMVDLDPESNYYSSKAHGCTADGNIVVGELVRTAGATHEAAIWTPAWGLVPLSDYLAVLYPDANPANLALGPAVGISADGRTICGNSSPNASGAYVVYLPAPPVNDTIAGAVDVSVGGAFTGSLNHATSDGYWGCPSGLEAGQPYPDVWYRYFPSGPGTLTVTTGGTNDLGGVDQGLDTMIDLDITPRLAGTPTICNDNYAPLAASAGGPDAGQLRDAGVSTSVVGGSTVYIRVRYVRGPRINPFRLNVTFVPSLAPPSITQQPMNTEICRQTSGTISVAASGQSVSYRWQYFTDASWVDVINGVNNITFHLFAASGAGTPTLTITPAAITLVNTQFRCVVSNGGGAVTSNECTVAASDTPSVGSLAPVTVCRDRPAVLSVQLPSNPPPNITWRMDGAVIFSGTLMQGEARDSQLPSGSPFTVAWSGFTATLTIPHLRVRDIGNYQLEARNACAAIQSNSARIAIIVADFNCNGEISVQDVFDFLAAWFARLPSADINGDNGVSLQDLFDFLAYWLAG